VTRRAKCPACGLDEHYRSDGLCEWTGDFETKMLPGYHLFGPAHKDKYHPAVFRPYLIATSYRVRTSASWDTVIDTNKPLYRTRDGILRPDWLLQLESEHGYDDIYFDIVNAYDKKDFVLATKLIEDFKTVLELTN